MKNWLLLTFLTMTFITRPEPAIATELTINYTFTAQILNRGPQVNKLNIKVNDNLLRGDAVEGPPEVMQSYLLFDNTTKKAWTVKPSRKAYAPLPPISRLIPDMLEQDPRFKNLPPEQREMLQKMLGGSPKTTGAPKKQVTYEPSDESQQHGSWSCKVYILKVDGKPAAKACIVPWGTAGISRGDLAIFTEFAGYVSSRSEKDSTRDWSQAPGIPIWTKSAEGISPSYESEIVKMNKSSASDSSSFKLPQGYQQIGLAELYSPAK